MEYLPFISKCLGRLDHLVHVQNSSSEIAYVGKLLSQFFKEFVQHEKCVIEASENDDNLLEGCNTKVHERLEEIVSQLEHITSTSKSKNLESEYEKVNILIGLRKELLVHKFEIDLQLIKFRANEEKKQILSRNAQPIKSDVSSPRTTTCNDTQPSISSFSNPLPIQEELTHDDDRIYQTCTEDLCIKPLQDEITYKPQSDREVEKSDFLIDKTVELKYESTKETSTESICCEQPTFLPRMVQDLDLEQPVKHPRILQKLKIISSSQCATSKFWQIWLNHYPPQLRRRLVFFREKGLLQSNFERWKWNCDRSFLKKSKFRKINFVWKVSSNSVVRPPD